MSSVRFVQSRTLWLAIIIGFFLVIAFIIGNSVKNSTVTAAITYTTNTVHRGELEALLPLTGRVNPINEIDLSFQISGVITNVTVKEGDSVKAGQLLAQLDSRELELDLSAAQASLKQAQARLEAVKAGPGKELDTARANLKQAQTRLQLAKASTSTPEDAQAAQAALDQAQARYNFLQNKPNPQDIKQAEAALREALARLDQAQNSPVTTAAPSIEATPQPTIISQVPQAEAALEAAKQNLASVTSSTNALKEQAQINLDQASRNFNNFKTAYEKIYAQNHNADGSVKPEVKDSDLDTEKAAKNIMDDAKSSLDKAKSALNDAQNQADSGQKEAQARVTEAEARLQAAKEAAKAPVNSNPVPASSNSSSNAASITARQQATAIAQAEVERAQAALDRARQGATKDELDGALAEIAGARARLDKLNKRSVDEKEVSLAQAEVDKASSLVDSLSRGPNAAELKAAQASVDETEAIAQRAQLRLQQTVLNAPFNGVIGQIKIAPGQNVTARSNVITLLDLSAFKVELVVPESDIGQVKPGLTARLTLDVLPGLKELRGQISDVAIKSSKTDSGLTGYAATILLDKTLNPEVELFNQFVKPGMTSNINLVLDHKTNVILVPASAIKTLSTTRAVDVVTGNGQLVTVPIQTGLKGEKEIEVLEPSLLIPGDQIIINNRVPDLGANLKVTAPLTARP